MTKYFTIPGYGGSDGDHWQSYFDSALENCVRIPQNNWTEPSLDDWVERIEQTLKGEDLSSVVLITHSLGAMALLHWFKRYNKNIKGAFLVAPPDVEFPYQDLGLDSFAPIPQIKLSFPSIVVASSNDHWMTTNRSEYFAKVWGSEFVQLVDAGHINADSGHTNWDQGLEILKRLA